MRVLQNQSKILVLEALLNNDPNITSIDDNFRFLSTCTRTQVSIINKYLYDKLGFKPITKKRHFTQNNKQYSTYHFIQNDTVIKEAKLWLKVLKDNQKSQLSKNNINDEVAKFGDQNTSSSSTK